MTAENRYGFLKVYLRCYRHSSNVTIHLSSVKACFSLVIDDFE